MEEHEFCPIHWYSADIFKFDFFNKTNMPNMEIGKMCRNYKTCLKIWSKVWIILLLWRTLSVSAFHCNTAGAESGYIPYKIFHQNINLTITEDTISGG